MFDDIIPADQSRILAELLDTALADKWDETGPTMALLWQVGDDPDDLRLAVKHLENSIDAELDLLDSGCGYLAAAHSVMTRTVPPELGPLTDGGPVRITVAIDDYCQSGVLRYRNGSTQWFGDAVGLEVADRLRARLWFEAA